MLMSLAGFGQWYKSRLVADETLIKEYKHSFVVNTCNNAIFKLIQGRFNIKTSDYTTKKRYALRTPYLERNIRFKKHKLTEVETYLKAL